MLYLLILQYNYRRYYPPCSTYNYDSYIDLYVFQNLRIILAHKCYKSAYYQCNLLKVCMHVLHLQEVSPKKVLGTIKLPVLVKVNPAEERVGSVLVEILIGNMSTNLLQHFTTGSCLSAVSSCSIIVQFKSSYNSIV